MKKVLVIQLSRLGDVLQSTVLLNSLKKENYKIFFIGDEKNQKIAEEIHLIDKFIPLKIGEFLEDISSNNLLIVYNKIFELIKNLNKENFDLLINLNHSNINLYLSQLINAKKKKGFKIEKSEFIDFIYNIIKNNRKKNIFNLVDIFNCFSLKPVTSNRLFIKKELDNKNLRFINKVFKKNYNIIFHTGAGHKLREWNISKFVKLAEIIMENIDTTITLTGIKNEISLGREFYNLLQPEYRKNIINLIGKTDIKLLKDLLIKSNLIISTDTGIMHLAAACNTNIIALFYASALVNETGPYTKNALIISPVEDCYPCTEIFQPCSDFHCKNNILEKDIFECVKYFFNISTLEDLKKYLKNREKQIDIFVPDFDKYGIFFKSILNKKYNLTKLREKGFKLCLNKTY